MLQPEMDKIDVHEKISMEKSAYVYAIAIIIS